MKEESSTRVQSALAVAIVGLLIPAGLVVFLVLNSWKADDVATIIGLFTSIVGTLVGAFLGVQVGAADKDKVQLKADAAQNLANRALAELDPAAARKVLSP